MQLLKALWALAGAALCCFLVLVIHAQFLKEGQLAAGTCEIVTLDRDSSQPRRTIARQTARCACRKGQIAGTTRARPACVDGCGHTLRIQTPRAPSGDSVLRDVTPSDPFQLVSWEEPHTRSQQVLPAQNRRGGQVCPARLSAGQPVDAQRV
ncbi:PREDICTED: protein FAM19A5 isoform X1 [Chinchilla lanigera]|uniref:protein FAM19A5 isoform X1 n=1 Tax=Chinchilla lanigera TaxID=34839 RepID=UPI000696745E|nr:PREDICTED: protein FAM19A5 isoform X1 [Chinchilla lanigera]